ncbi:hypothetical protein IJ380_02340 [Candidatus Saccharibacteria bacterium]|nr:hypothetical protein [Candidatus Saccharibacteria bacterium]
MFNKSSTFQIPGTAPASEPAFLTVSNIPDYDYKIFLELNQIAEEIDRCRGVN